MKLVLCAMEIWENRQHSSQQSVAINSRISFLLYATHTLLLVLSTTMFGIEMRLPPEKNSFWCVQTEQFQSNKTLHYQHYIKLLTNR